MGRLGCGYLTPLPACAVGFHLAGMSVVYPFGNPFELGAAHRACLRVHAS